MEYLSKRVLSGLAKLNEKFITALPDRLKEIQVALFSAEESAWRKEETDFLILLVHRLAGSGATFGCDELSEKSKEMELLLKAFPESASPSGKGVEKIHALLEEINEEYLSPKEYIHSASKEGTEVTEPTRKTEDGKVRILCLVKRDHHVFDGIISQLGFFGYCVQVFNDVGELKEHLFDGEKQLLIVDPQFLEEYPEAQQELKELKAAFGHSLNMVFISEKDGFSERLRCVRTGGEDFFIRPLDIVRVIDRIDEITSEIKGKPYHILIVDDDIEQLSAYAMLLQQSGMITSVASDPSKVLSILAEAKPDLIILDLYMPECGGTELASIIRQEEAYVSIPIVFLSIETDEDRQQRAVGFGGDDFIVKSIRPENLVSSIRTRVERTRRMRFHMERDSLTGLLNHSNLKEQLRREILRAERSDSKVCFAMIDLDYFKKVNDTYGHLAGDKVIKSLCRLLQERLRRTDVIGRYGGEEFGVVLINTSQEDAGSIMDEIRVSFAAMPHFWEDQEFFVTFSCGIACYPDIKRQGEIIPEADKALYCAKENGRNQVVLASSPEKS